MQLMTCRETPLRGLHFGIIAAFLLNQVVLDSSGFFGGSEERLPRGNSFSCQNLVSLLRDQSFTCTERMRPGFRLIQATGSLPAAKHVPTYSCSVRVRCEHPDVLTGLRLRPTMATGGERVRDSASFATIS